MAAVVASDRTKAVKERSDIYFVISQHQSICHKGGASTPSRTERAAGTQGFHPTGLAVGLGRPVRGYPLAAGLVVNTSAHRD